MAWFKKGKSAENAEKPVKFYFETPPVSTTDLRNVGKMSHHSRLSNPNMPVQVFDLNEEVMLSCWKTVHGSVQELDTCAEKKRSSNKRLLRSASIAVIGPLNDEAKVSLDLPSGRHLHKIASCDNLERSNGLIRRSVSTGAVGGAIRRRHSVTDFAQIQEESENPIDDFEEEEGLSELFLKTNNRHCSHHKRDAIYRPLEGIMEMKNRVDHVAASRQKSFPLSQSELTVLEDDPALQNEVKRHSLPLSVVYQKAMMNKIVLSQSKTSDHVEELTDAVPELFQSIRGATQRDIFEEMEQKSTEEIKACYEVMYVGRAKVRGKKIHSSHIDDLVMRLESKDHKNSITADASEDSRDRRRHKSDSSVQSLPTLVDETLIKENELQKLSQNTIYQGVEFQNDSLSGSCEDVERLSDLRRSSRSGSVDQLSDGHSSSENILDGLNQSNSGDQLKDMFHGLQQHPESTGSFQDAHGNQQGKSLNRTMLLRIGQNDIALISLDKKQTIIERKFKNISSVSQGNLKPDVFGFISREPGSQLLCHLLRCCTSQLTDEIMLALKTAFQNAYQQSRLQTQQICINCPLHQYHKLCQEINGQQAETAYNILCKRIQQLPEKDSVELNQSLQNENPQSHEEWVEVLMIRIRKLCELKQREHSHISDANKGSQKPDFFLVEMKDKGNKSPFDFLRNRAKKTLSQSFESLITNVHTKTEEVRDAFRLRSMTNEGDFNRLSDDMSPAQLNKDHISFDFSSPPPSPTETSRPRSATVGALPDVSTMEKMKARQAGKLQGESRDADKRRASESPMKHMFNLANTGSPLPHASGPSGPGGESLDNLTIPEQATPMRRGSWRQAIFNRVVTPAKQPCSPTLEESAEEFEDKSKDGKKTSEELRALWRKAILETLLLIRMERENIELQARQDEANLKRQKLDYAEITPCLKEVSRLWDEMLNQAGRSKIKVEYEKLLSCVKEGVPQSKRGDIWRFLIEQHRLKFPSIEENTPTVEYSELLKQLTNHQHAILIDLSRTFPGHPYFATQLGSGQLALFNLLKAYSLMDAEVGYCQGLSFVAGVLLMHMEEKVAFDMWKHLMYNLGFRKQYKPNMIALQIQLYQLTRLLHDNYKDLYDHFEVHEIAPTLYAAPWFLTLFASQFPLGFVARVFDLIFIQGTEVIFKVAMVLLGNHKELIMQCSSFETVVDFIKTTLPEMSMIQMERVINQVFDLDISKQLQSYEVEYHVLKEEMMYSPNRSDTGLLDKLEQTNQTLKHQNMELIEKLQNAHSHERSLENMIHNYQTQEAKLKSHIKTLELERTALLNAVAKLKQCVPESAQIQLDLPDITPSMPCSPLHAGKGPQWHSGKFTEPDGKILENGGPENDSTKFDKTKSARIHPERGS